MSEGAAVPEPGDVGGDHCCWRNPVAVVRTLVEMATHLAGGVPGDDNAIPRCVSCLYRYSNSRIIEIRQIETTGDERPVPQPTPEKNGPTSPSSPPFALKAWRKIQRFSSVVRTAITGPQHCQKKKECMESAKKTSTDETESRGRFYLHEDAPLLSEKVENAR